MNATARRRVLIVDAHAVVRAGLRTILNEHPDLVVVAEAGTKAEALEALGAQPCDVVVVDLALPDGSGFDLLKAAQTRRASLPPVLILSSHRDDQYAIQALRHGAAGFLSKDMAADELAAAVRRVAAGGRYLSPEVAVRLAGTVLDGDSGLEPHERLTPRELEVFLRIAAGRSLVSIAEELHVSPKTVTSWRSRILEKLGLENNAALARYALLKGLLQG